MQAYSGFVWQYQMHEWQMCDNDWHLCYGIEVHTWYIIAF